MPKYHVSVGKKESTIRVYDDACIDVVESAGVRYYRAVESRKHLLSADLFDSEKEARGAIAARIEAQVERARKVLEAAEERLERFREQGPKVRVGK